MKKFLLLFLALATSAFAADKKHVLLLAGKPSHGPGDHEHNAGVMLFAKCLTENAADKVEVKYKLNADWPSKEELKWADTILFYSDGGGGHFMLGHLEDVAAEMKRGCGLVCVHYAVEYPKDKGGPEMLEWMGGYFEAHWSVNPHWTANFKEFPKHPIANGVKPFSTNDEWYFHMRFRPDMDKDKVIKILQDIPPASTMEREDGSHSGNPDVRKAVESKQPQAVAWAYERKTGGRGFGFTGGHFHKGWGNDDQRKLVLNAILWTAKAEVPAKGVESKITEEDLKANLDKK